jgi:hypothetical protein
MTKGNYIMIVLGIIAITAGIIVHSEARSFHKMARMTEGKVVYVLGSTYKIQYFTEDGTEKIKRISAKSHFRGFCILLGISPLLVKKKATTDKQPA